MHFYHLGEDKVEDKVKEKQGKDRTGQDQVEGSRNRKQKTLNRNHEIPG